MDDKVYYSRYGDLKEGVKQGSNVDIQPLLIVENGVYNAPEGVAYDPVNVDVQGGSQYVETELWSNPDDSKGIKEMTLLVDDIIGYDYLKFNVRNINNGVEYYDVIYDVNKIREIGAFAVISNDKDTETLYARKCWLKWNGSKNELWCSGNVMEAGGTANKNFRAVISKVYGIKKEG